VITIEHFSSSDCRIINNHDSSRFVEDKEDRQC